MPAEKDILYRTPVNRKKWKGRERERKKGSTYLFRVRTDLDIQISGKIYNKVTLKRQ